MDEPGRRPRGAFDWIVERVSARIAPADDPAESRASMNRSPELQTKVVAKLSISGSLLEITGGQPLLAGALAPNLTTYACLVSNDREARRLTILRPGVEYVQGAIGSLADAAPTAFDAVAWWHPPEGSAWMYDATRLLKPSGVLLTRVDANWLQRRAALSRGGWDPAEWFTLANASGVLAAFTRSKRSPKK